MENLRSITSKQRQLIADMDTPEQVKTLHSLIKNPPQNSRVVEFSPELALYILDNLNVGNRTQKARSISRYAADMTNGNWSLTGVPIVFGSHGYLLDGQNRLAACVRANKPFRTHAVFGVAPESFVHFDIGKTRTSVDVFTTMGVPYPKDTGHAIRMIQAWSTGRTDTRSIETSNDQLREAYHNIDQQLLEFAIKEARKTNRVTSYPVSSLVALIYIASKNGHSEKVKQFVRDLAAGFGDGPRAPCRLLLEKVAFLKMDRSQTITQHMYTIMLARTWVNYKMGKASVKRDMIVKLDDALPTI